MKSEVSSIVIDGCDLTGKSTLIKNIHNHLLFRWNIHDRSSLSMLVHAIQYERDVKKWRKKLNEELRDLRNFMVVLQPKFSVIKERYRLRGDEIQNLESLKLLHSIFETEIRKIESYPNVLVVRDDVANHRMISEKILEYEQPLEISILASRVAQIVKAQNGKSEEVFLEFETDDDVSDVILSNPHEKVYYTEIIKKFEGKVQWEISPVPGWDYTPSCEKIYASRRFIYADDSCISMLHATINDGIFTLRAYFRSTDVIRNATIDTEFINYCAFRIAKQVLDFHGTRKIMISYGCPHVRNDL